VQAGPHLVWNYQYNPFKKRLVGRETSGDNACVFGDLTQSPQKPWASQGAASLSHALDVTLRRVASLLNFGRRPGRGARGDVGVETAHFGKGMGSSIVGNHARVTSGKIADPGVSI